MRTRDSVKESVEFVQWPAEILSDIVVESLVILGLDLSAMRLQDRDLQLEQQQVKVVVVLHLHNLLGGLGVLFGNSGMFKVNIG